MYCQFLLKRQKNYKTVFYCKLKKGYIDYRLECKNCSDFNLAQNKGIKKVSNKRIFVTEEIYNKVYDRDKGKCRLCGTIKNLHLHHIRYRSERKDLINEPNNLIFLCINCHNLVHSNKKKYQPILLELIKEGKNER